MTNPKGRVWETRIAGWLNAHGRPQVEVRAKSGRFDRGDISGLHAPGIGPVAVEAKWVEKLDFSGWLREAEVERVNAKAAIGVVWAHKRGRSSPGDAYVVMTGDTFMTILDALKET